MSDKYDWKISEPRYNAICFYWGEFEEALCDTIDTETQEGRLVVFDNSDWVFEVKDKETGAKTVTIHGDDLDELGRVLECQVINVTIVDDCVWLIFDD